MIPVEAQRTSWPDLLAHPAVRERLVLGSAFGFMAFHAGLEGGTLEIAETAVERSGASFYAVTQPADLRWHVPSAEVDPARSPLLARWLDHVKVAVALHGYGRLTTPRAILVGGSNRGLADAVAAAIDCHLTGFSVVRDLDRIPADLRGMHPANPVNLPPDGGVQLELPPSARGTSARLPDSAWGPGGAPARVADALAAVALGWCG